MMLPTITFEIYYPETAELESFLIENTPANQELVFTNSQTRSIRFTKTFDFQFAREMRIPLEFISMSIWIQLMNVKPHLFTAVAE